MKKITFLLLSIFISTSAFAGVSTSKVFDGSLATCTTLKDTQINKTGIYRLQAKEIQDLGDSVIISVNAEFLNCVELTTNEYQFQLVSPFKSFSYIFPSPDGDVEVNVSIDSAEIIAVKDGVYKVITTVDVGEDSEQTLEFELPKSEVMDTDNKGSFDLSLRKIIIYGANGQYNSVRKLFGDFRIHFDLD